MSRAERDANVGLGSFFPVPRLPPRRAASHVLPNGGRTLPAAMDGERVFFWLDLLTWLAFLLWFAAWTW